uniref:Hexosyltransferase n=1 Tax=Wuchereria bancrofti TaxID=6293 RepID=A0AAF5RY39_WUCBA
MFDYVNIIQTYFVMHIIWLIKGITYRRIQLVAISNLDSFGIIFCHRVYRKHFCGYIDANTEVIQVLIKKASFKTLKRYGESQYNPSMHHFFMDTTLDRLYFREVLLELTGQPASYLYENWAYFEPFHIPTCKFSKAMNKFLLIIVKFSPLHFLLNEIFLVLETASNTVTWDSVFNHSDFTMIGRELFNQENKRPQKEIDLYNDILVGDYIGSYRNNILEISVQFLFSYCHHHYNFPYALFVDEDYLVLRLFRTRFHIHRVSIATYPFNCYPPYITVGAVLLSSQTIRKMYYAIQHTKLYSYDDIYAGILAKSLKLTIKHNKNMYWKAEVGVEEAKTLICA